MTDIQQGNKLAWADNLRALATIGVIVIHVSGLILYQFNTISEAVWWTGNIYDSAVRFCVPIFLMLTGALLLPKHYELGDFLKKKLYRIIIPLAFWSFIYIGYFYYKNFIQGDKISLIESVRWILIQLKQGASYHMWYLYMIIGIYLFIPIIGKWVRNSTEKEIKYFLMIWLFTLLLRLPIISSFTPNIDLTYFTGYLGYLILGYYLTTKSFENLFATTIIACLLALLGVLITIFGTASLSGAEGQYVDTLYAYLSPNVLIVSIGIFVLFKTRNITNPMLIVIIHFISKYSYGIYLVHILVLLFLSNLGISWKLINPIIGIPVTTFLALSVSGIIIYTINKLPYGKYISG
jgi:surface polysaccharide O-acyltransferase-like enzyme